MGSSGDDPGFLEDSFRRRLHVIPVGDTHLHSAQKICWCYPRELDDKIVWQHNAKDCRDARERVTGNNTGDLWIIIAEYVPIESAPS